MAVDLTLGMKFQHTAARRRLGSMPFLSVYFRVCFNTQPPEGGWRLPNIRQRVSCCFNTQPPEGGWVQYVDKYDGYRTFQHTAARRRLGALLFIFSCCKEFQHTAARRRLDFGV